MCLFAICISFWMMYVLRLSFKSLLYIYILGSHYLLDVSFANIFSESGLLLILLMLFFSRVKAFLIFMKSNLLFLFYFIYFY